MKKNVDAWKIANEKQTAAGHNGQEYNTAPYSISTLK